MRASVKTKIVSLVLLPREREKVPRRRGADEGRWDETIPAGEVSDPCKAPFNGAPSVVEGGHSHLNTYRPAEAPGAVSQDRPLKAVPFVNR
jgi:hypothetical protein